MTCSHASGQGRRSCGCGAVSYSSPSAPLLGCGLYWLCLPDPTQYVIAGTSLSGATGQIADLNSRLERPPAIFIHSPLVGNNIYNISYESSSAMGAEAAKGNFGQLSTFGQVDGLRPGPLLPHSLTCAPPVRTSRMLRILCTQGR